MPDQASATSKRPRDPRLDFFRGIAMIIILFAHIPVNGWTLWIPARFGFSDATEIFVFCSGLASAMAFGAVFRDRGWLLGAARIAHRVWQVYWAHVCVFLLTTALLVVVQRGGFGAETVNYLTRPLVLPFLSRTEEALVGLLTLRYVPGLFDILPMYLVILALTPLVVATQRAGGTAAAAAAVVCVWLAANLAGLGRGGAGAIPEVGSPFEALNLPATPWGVSTWFFNPFAWQLLFFAGFGFGMGWLKPPPVTRRLVRAAAAVLIVSIPFAWHRIYLGLWIPADWAAVEAIAAVRAAAEPLIWKTWLGGFRVLHFFALAYIAWVLVGPRGERISEPLPLRRVDPALRRRLAPFAAAVAALTTPYAHVVGIRAISPALDAWALETIPILSPEMIGWVSLIHAAAAATLVWCAIPSSAMRWAADEGWARLTRALRRVGSQSLAVFMTSIPLSQLCGVALDLMGTGYAATALVNVVGVAVLTATAYLVGWIKGQPWRRPASRPLPSAAVRAPAE